MKLTRRSFAELVLKSGIICAMPPVPVMAAERSRGPAGGPGAADALDDDLSSAPPWVYWMWFNGNITRASLTADLEAMREIGIRGALVMTIGSGAEGPVRFLSPKWQQLVRYVIAEAFRLGIQIDFNNDAGWDMAGPWVTPEHAMKKLVWSESHVRGGQSVKIDLPQPETVFGFYRDIGVFAVPAPIGSSVKFPVPRVKEIPGNPSRVSHDYGSDITARAITLNAWIPGEAGGPNLVWTLQASSDGKDYQTVYSFDHHWQIAKVHWPVHISMSMRLKPITARFFRVVLPFTRTLGTHAAPGKRSGEVSDIDFELIPDERISLWPTKGGHDYELGAALIQPAWDPRGWRDPFIEYGSGAPGAAEAGSIIRSNEIVDLSSHFHDGKIEWDAPEGEWVVFRSGYTLTGNKNRIAAPDSKGLNVDTLSKDGIDNHFPHVMGLLLKQSPEYAGKSLTYFHSDSWECGPQNWTQALMEEFQSRRGYSMQPYMAVLCGGRIIDSAAISNRFLWDFRRTLADLIAENFWGRLGELCHQHGMKASGEGAGRGSFMPDPVLYLSKSDLPMGEFWRNSTRIHPDCQLAASVANSYGKTSAGAESYTCMGTDELPYAGYWHTSPFEMKALGDLAFCGGINHYVFHRYASQPRLNAKPGITWVSKSATGGVGIGTNMDRSQTWWKPAKAWIAYISRCQNLLRSGKPVVDVCCLVTEGIPSWLFPPDGLLPGYRYDGIHSEQLQSIKVEDGRLVLPSGMSYRILALPYGSTITPGAIRQVERLLQAGAVIVGTKPATSPSLSDYPACDNQVSEVAERCWGEGKIFPSVTEALGHIALEEDFRYTADPKAEIKFQHRRVVSKDIYFVSNQSDEKVRVIASFRIQDRMPHIFDPDSGDVHSAGAFTAEHGRTSVPLMLDHSGSAFIVFEGAVQPTIVHVERMDGLPSLYCSGHEAAVGGLAFESGRNGQLTLTSTEQGKYRLTTSNNRTTSVAIPAPQTLAVAGLWHVKFPPGWGAPSHIQLDKLISWTDHIEDGVRYFSGSATYSIDFHLGHSSLGSGRAAFLDLGEVRVIAEALLNGKPLGIRWKMPFRYEVGSLLQPGRNQLSITVTNLWPNRMIGDKSLPPDKGFTWTNSNPYQRNTPLLRSGLLGPVQLIIAKRIKVPI